MKMKENSSIFNLYSEKYKELSVLKSSSMCCTYLVKDKSTQVLYIAKITLQKSNLYNAIKELSHKSLPKIKEIYSEEETTIIIEEFVKGKSLSEFIEEGITFDEKKVLDIALQLCDVLKLLHSKNIIHRDIKPSNIIITPNNIAVLIDFDASRFASVSKSSDTVVIGTKGYAPPEQYGFAQTDQRADIYALGITLKELLGNNYNSSLLRYSINKAIQIDPKKRYKTIQKFNFALKYKSSKLYFFIILDVPVFLICVVIVFVSIFKYFSSTTKTDTNNIKLGTETKTETEAESKFKIDINEPYTKSDTIDKLEPIERLPEENIYLYENVQYGASAHFPDFLEFKGYSDTDIIKSSIFEGQDYDNNNHRLTFLTFETPDSYGENITMENIKKSLSNVKRFIKSETIGSRFYLTYELNENQNNIKYVSFVIYHTSNKFINTAVGFSSNSDLDTHLSLFDSISQNYNSPLIEIHDIDTSMPNSSFELSNLEYMKFPTLQDFVEFMTRNNITLEFEESFSDENQFTHIAKFSSTLDPKISGYIHIEYVFGDISNKWNIRKVIIN